MKEKRIAILGSTGSIGRQALEVLAADGLRPCAVSGFRNRELLARQARIEGVEFVAASDDETAAAIAGDLPEGVELVRGPGALSDLVKKAKPDLVVSAVLGAAGMEATLTSLENGATVALANKEALVCGGELIMKAAGKSKGAIIPIDSEHSGIFQCLFAGKRDEIRRIIITSSGGALRDWPDEKAGGATVEDVLKHPTWDMGAKITVDSSTLMNKALEIIEAHWLFGLAPEQIEVIIHPQSIVHAMVEFHDGSVIAQMAAPDMKLPISFALHHPDRPCRQVEPMDPNILGRLEFSSVPQRNIAAIALAREAIRRGGACGAVLNAANEVAVEAFLSGEIRFGDILPVVEDTFSRWKEGTDIPSPPPRDEITLMFLLTADGWSRRYARHLVSVAEKQNGG